MTEMNNEIVIDESQIPANVLEAIADGRKVVAIKLLREATGIGLANAKVIVDRAAARHAQANPQRAGFEEESNTGRLLVMMLVLVLAFVLYRFFFNA